MERVALLLTLMLLAACEGPDEPLFPNSPSPTEDTSFPSPTGTPAGSPTPPALPQEEPPSSGPATADCIDGWTRPEPGSTLATEPIRLIRRSVRVPGEPTVVELRYFTGPESPPSDKGYLLEVDRWYVKLFTGDDLTFQGRFLVERREFGSGVVAVVPYDTRGFRSPDWSGFQWNAGDADKEAYAGLPGTWSGIRYDFVRGGAGLEVPGLPASVAGCMEGT
jgi:hypothetical protein